MKRIQDWLAETEDKLNYPNKIEDLLDLPVYKKSDELEGIHSACGHKGVTGQAGFSKTQAKKNE